MIKEALQYLIGLGQAYEHRIGNQVLTDKPLHVVAEPTADPFVAHTLSGLVDYLLSDFDKQMPVMVHIAGPTEVRVLRTYTRDKRRDHLMTAKALLPTIPFGRFLDLEEFNILLQSCFVPNDDRAAVLRIVGNVREDNVTTYGDDGVSQQVTAKAGVATVADVPIPNPVLLKPFRTFAEIEQPQSAFVFRMQRGPVAALIEADGGAWKLDAIAAINEYLSQQLADRIVDKSVTIIA